MSFTRIQLPQFGGEGMTVVANDQAVMVDGTKHVSVRIPMSTRSKMFSNYESDTLDKQVVVEIGSNTDDRLEVRVALLPRTADLVNISRLYLQPGLDESARISIEIENGRLIVGAYRPYVQGGEYEKYTLLDVPLEQVLATASA